ncbi:membrane hypothetical protein [metagenome]|uniref:Uncharacterized protein n=1 Tax=metagenome TaxID=256318 RepID=A0A2P2CKV1_9ZZZZ
MLATLLVAAAMVICLGVAYAACGAAPSRSRVLGTSLLGILASVVAWMLLGTVMTVPESGVAALAVFLIALSAGLARTGSRASARGPA